MRAIVESRAVPEVRAVISNRPDSAGLEWAKSHGIATKVVDHKAHPTRDAFDAAMADAIEGHSPDLVLLAGFMRIFTPACIARFRRRILNIHPSLLPSFPGLHTHRQALAAGVKLHGCTVHMVTTTLDAGPIVAQAAVPVLADDTEEQLADRVLAQEHRLYPQVVRWFVEDRVTLRPDGVVQVRGPAVAAAALHAPHIPP